MTDSASPARQAAPEAPETGRIDTSHGARMILVVLALAAGFAFVPRMTQGCGKAASGQEAPDFTADLLVNSPDPTRPTLTLSALRGHPVVLDFWATWCGPCQAEAPIVNGIAERFKDKGLVVIGVNTSDAAGRRLVPAFAAKKNLSFPMVFDEGDEIAHKYQVDNLPTLIVVSKEGKIVAVRHGVTSDSDLERLVRQVL